MSNFLKKISITLLVVFAFSTCSFAFVKSASASTATDDTQMYTTTSLTSSNLDSESGITDPAKNNPTDEGKKDTKDEKKDEKSKTWMWILIVIVAVAIIGGLIFLLKPRRDNEDR